MASSELQLNAKMRHGRASQVRAQDQVPAVVYGHGIENAMIQVDSKMFDKVFHEAGYTMLVDLSVEGREHNVLIKDIQHHPLRGEVIHVDFYQVRMDEVVSANVPILFVGEASAVKELGGVFVRNIDTIEVEALPKDLPREFKVDISILQQFDTRIRIRDLKVEKTVTVLDDKETVICLVQAPRTEAELEQLSGEVSEDVESVEGVKDKPADELVEEGDVATNAEAEVPSAPADKN